MIGRLLTRCAVALAGCVWCAVPAAAQQSRPYHVAAEVSPSAALDLFAVRWDARLSLPAVERLSTQAGAAIHALSPRSRNAKRGALIGAGSTAAAWILLNCFSDGCTGRGDDDEFSRRLLLLTPFVIGTGGALGAWIGARRTVRQPPPCARDERSNVDP